MSFLGKIFVSLVGKIFAYTLKWRIKNDPIINKAIRDADENTAKTRKEILELCDGDKEKVKKALPESVRKYLGFDF